MGNGGSGEAVDGNGDNTVEDSEIGVGSGEGVNNGGSGETDEGSGVDWAQADNRAAVKAISTDKKNSART